MILFHNESSHLPTWPMRQFFFCVIPSATGGTTPLLDSRTVYNALEPTVREQFETKGLMYVRNFAEGIDVPWQDFFHTTDRSEVERVCTETGMTCEWTAGDGLRIRQVSPAVVIHPRTGEKLFFNQVQLHHVYCLDDETRSSLADIRENGLAVLLQVEPPFDQHETGPNRLRILGDERTLLGIRRGDADGIQACRTRHLNPCDQTIALVWLVDLLLRVNLK